MTQTARETWETVMEKNVKVTLPLGPNTVDRYINDPKRLAFMLARYKCAAKLMSRCESILDCGCGDGFGTLTFLHDTHAPKIIGVDFDGDLIGYATAILTPAVHKVSPVNASRLRWQALDIFDLYQLFNGICCLDMIEHLKPEDNSKFISHLSRMLPRGGICIIGTPNAYAEQYASEHSKVGHINLLTHENLRSLLEEEFSTVFLFSMSDEVLHLGFEKLGHYIFAVAVK